MAKYPDHLREQARDLWLACRRTDEEIAAEVGVARADTIRDWRREGDWDSLRQVVEEAIADRREQERVSLNARHDQLGEAIESMIVQKMRAKKADGSPAIEAADVRSLASALASTQRVRRLAQGMRVDVPEKIPRQMPNIVFGLIPDKSPRVPQGDPGEGSG